jgi:hypothetical protein
MVERVKLLQGANGAAKRMFGGNLMIFDMQTCVFLFTESRVQSPESRVQSPESRQTDRQIEARWRVAVVEGLEAQLREISGVCNLLIFALLLTTATT